VKGFSLKINGKVDELCDTWQQDLTWKLEREVKQDRTKVSMLVWVCCCFTLKER